MYPDEKDMKFCKITDANVPFYITAACSTQAESIDNTITHDLMMFQRSPGLLTVFVISYTTIAAWAPL